MVNGKIPEKLIEPYKYFAVLIFRPKWYTKKLLRMYFNSLRTVPVNPNRKLFGTHFQNYIE